MKFDKTLVAPYGLTVIGLILMGLAIFGTYEALGYYRHGYSDDAQLPPGYKMTCNHNGQYVPLAPFGTELTDFRSHRPFKNRGRAVWRAWKQFNYTYIEDATFNFPRCD